MSDTPRPLRAALLLLFCAMLLFSFLTPLTLDDFSYCFSFVDQARMTSLAQLIPSMAAHRVCANGRLVPHALVQLLMMCPKAVFNLLNAANALLLALLFSRYFVDLRGGAAALCLCVGAMLIWNFSPAFGESFLWLDGAINYAWGLSALLLFLWPYAADYLGISRKTGALRLALFLLISFVAGSWSENGAISTLFAACCLFALVWAREKKLPLALLGGLVAAGLGYVWLMTAPATFGKSAPMTLSALAANAVSVLSFAREKLLLLYVLYALLLTAALHVRADRRRLILSGILVLAGLASLGCFVFAKYFERRHFCYTVVVTALACLLPFSALLREKKTQLLCKLCAAALAVLFLFNLAAGMIDLVVGYSKSLEREAAVRQARQSGAEELWLEEHLCATAYGVHFSLVDNPLDFPNLGIGRYYGFNGAHKLASESAQDA